MNKRVIERRPGAFACLGLPELDELVEEVLATPAQGAATEPICSTLVSISSQSCRSPRTHCRRLAAPRPVSASSPRQERRSRARSAAAWRRSAGRAGLRSPRRRGLSAKPRAHRAARRDPRDIGRERSSGPAPLSFAPSRPRPFSTSSSVAGAASSAASPRHRGRAPRWPRPGAPAIAIRLQTAPVRLRRLVEEALEQGDLDIGVASLAERVGQLLHLLQRLARAWREAGLEDLERRAQARVATRMSCTRSTSSRSSTPSECAKTSSERTLTTLAAAFERPLAVELALRAPATAEAEDGLLARRRGGARSRWRCR